MRKKYFLFILVAVLFTIATTFQPATASGKNYCDFVNWLRKQESQKSLTSLGTSFRIPVQHINPKGWTAFLILASGEFTPKQVDYFIKELEQMGKIQFDGQESRFLDNDPKFCKPPGKPASEPNLAPAPESNSSDIKTTSQSVIPASVPILASIVCLIAAAVLLASVRNRTATI